MALRKYKHKVTGEEKRSLIALSKEHWSVVLEAPHNKFMVSSNKATGKSKIKDLKEILTKRSRNFARDNDIPEQMTVSQENGMTDVATKNLLSKDGLRRNKLDDL